MSQLDLRKKDTNPDKVYYDLTLSKSNINNDNGSLKFSTVSKLYTKLNTIIILKVTKIND